MTIKQKQCLLNYLGYNTGGVDGAFGPLSVKATAEFQSAYGLTVDGAFGQLTEARILEVIANGESPQKVQEEDVKDSLTTGTFWDHIRYWTREEFKCRCGEYHAPYCNGYPVEPDQTLVELADDVRAHFGRPGIRSSGIRCPQHNADQQNSAANSRHLYGKALDFYIEGITGTQLLAYVQSDPRTRYAYIIEGNYVHMDVN